MPPHRPLRFYASRNGNRHRTRSSGSPSAIRCCFETASGPSRAVSGSSRIAMPFGQWRSTSDKTARTTQQPISNDRLTSRLIAVEDAVHRKATAPNIPPIPSRKFAPILLPSTYSILSIIAIRPLSTPGISCPVRMVHPAVVRRILRRNVPQSHGPLRYSSKFPNDIRESSPKYRSWESAGSLRSKPAQ